MFPGSWKEPYLARSFIFLQPFHSVLNYLCIQVHFKRDEPYCSLALSSMHIYCNFYYNSHKVTFLIILLTLKSDRKPRGSQVGYSVWSNYMHKVCGVLLQPRKFSYITNGIGFLGCTHLHYCLWHIGARSSQLRLALWVSAAGILKQEVMSRGSGFMYDLHAEWYKMRFSSSSCRGESRLRFPCSEAFKK